MRKLKEEGTRKIRDVKKEDVETEDREEEKRKIGIVKADSI